MNPCVINYALDGREQYEKGQARLRRSLDAVGYKGSTLFTKSLPAGCPEHDVVPYAFKPFLMKEAFKKGHDALLWLDASAVVLKPLTQIWNLIESTGFFFAYDPEHTLDKWAGDTQLKAMGCPIKEAPNIRIRRGGAWGVHRRHSDMVSEMLNLVGHQGGGRLHRNK